MLGLEIVGVSEVSGEHLASETRDRIIEVTWMNIAASVRTRDRNKAQITVTAADVTSALRLAFEECLELNDAQNAVRVAKQATEKE